MSFVCFMNIITSIWVLVLLFLLLVPTVTTVLIISGFSNIHIVVANHVIMSVMVVVIIFVVLSKNLKLVFVVFSAIATCN